MQSSQATASASTGAPVTAVVQCAGGETLLLGSPGEAVGERLVGGVEDVDREDSSGNFEQPVGAMLVVDDHRDEGRLGGDRNESRNGQAMGLRARFQGDEGDPGREMAQSVAEGIGGDGHGGQGRFARTSCGSLSSFVRRHRERYDDARHPHRGRERVRARPELAFRELLLLFLPGADLEPRGGDGPTDLAGMDHHRLGRRGADGRGSRRGRRDSGAGARAKRSNTPVSARSRPRSERCRGTTRCASPRPARPSTPRSFPSPSPFPDR